MFGAAHLEIRRPSPTTVEFTVTTQPRRTGWTGWAVAVMAVAIRLMLAIAAGLTLWVWSGRATPVVTAAAADSRLIPLWVMVCMDGLLGPERAAQVALQIRPWVQAVPAHVVVPACAAAAWASVARVHTSESLLVLRGLGIQTQSTGATYVGELVAGVSLVWWAATSAPGWLLLGDGGGSGASGSNDSNCVDSPSSAPSLTSRLALWMASHEALPAATRFIPTEKLQDLLVNEAFRGFEVRYYLVAVAAGGAVSGSSNSGNGRQNGGGGKITGRLVDLAEEEDNKDQGHAMDDADTGRRQQAPRRRVSGGAERAEGYNDDDGDDDDDNDDHDDDDNFYLDDASDADSTGGPYGSDEDEGHVVVVFPRLLPRLDIVRTVWREARACLYEPSEKGRG